MNEIEAISGHLSRYSCLLSQKIDRLYNALEELQRTTLLFLDSNTIPSEIDDWLEKEGFSIDDDGFFQSLPLLAAFREGVAKDDAISFSWGKHLCTDPTARQHLYCHRNIGPQLKHIRNRLGEVGWIYYQDVSNTSIQYPYIDQCTAISSDFDWLTYHTMRSVSPENNPERQIQWTPPNIDYAGEGLILSVSIPVWRKKKFIGVWSIDLPLRYLYQDFESAKAFSDQEQFITNGQGLLILHEKLQAEIDRSRGSIFLHPLAELGGEWKDIDLAAIIDAGEGVLEIMDAKGAEWIYCYNYIPGVEWTLFCGLPKLSMEEAAENRLRDAFKQIGEGNYSHIIESSPSFALPSLVEEFNRMSLRLNNEEKQRLEVEAQLRQAQKMEAIGRLAGGLAHDFNNITGVIMGYADMALEKLDKDDPLYEDIEEIGEAATRSMELTRQLLAFARRQPIAPKVLDINRAVNNILKMLQRLMGEDIKLVWHPGDMVWPVQIDPSQLDQILTNLCANARDAINGVGKVIIETTNTVLDEDYCSNHKGATPGEFVQLSITDDGKGMDSESLTKIFEPFYSTKAVGSGTGLGLATIYGIVKQNKCFIDVSSEPWVGSTFTIYLPRITGQSVDSLTKSDVEKGYGNNESILLVEDDVAVLGLADRMLKDLGYKVLAVNSSPAALNVVKQHKMAFDLLVTDVIMPELNGQDLAARMQSILPGLKVLFISGYPSNIISQDWIINKDVILVQKPFSQEQLAAKVREVLDKTVRKNNVMGGQASSKPS